MSNILASLDTANSLDKLFHGRNQDLAAAIIEIVTEWREFWPLTVRQVFYQCVVRSHVPNKHSEYARVSRVLTPLRRDDHVPWIAIEDRTRRTTGKRGLRAVDEYIQVQLETFLNPRYYGRCYIQNQAVYVEVSSEKDALASILEEAVWPYCTRLNTVRGQVGSSMVENMAGRFDRAIMRGKEPILVHFGDLDPSGVAIPKALVRNMESYHGVRVRLVRAALNPDQITRYHLPASLDAAKQSDPNYKAWLEAYGQDQMPVELDAIPPDTLKAIVRETLDGLYDMSEVSEQKAIEAQEREVLGAMRLEVTDFLYGRWPEVFREAA